MCFSEKAELTLEHYPILGEKQPLNEADSGQGSCSTPGLWPNSRTQARWQLHEEDSLAVMWTGVSTVTCGDGWATGEWQSPGLGTQDDFSSSTYLGHCVNQTVLLERKELQSRCERLPSWRWWPGRLAGPTARQGTIGSHHGTLQVKQGCMTICAAGVPDCHPLVRGSNLWNLANTCCPLQDPYQKDNTSRVSTFLHFWRVFWKLFYSWCQCYPDRAYIPTPSGGDTLPTASYLWRRKSQ